MSKEAMKLALELRALADRFSEGWHEGIKIDASDIVLLSDAAEALAEQKSGTKQVIELYDSPDQPAQQEPVAWLITDEKINSLQADSIQRLIDRARHAHMTDIKLRINGQDEWYQADWLKHLIRATPPQRTWVGLTEKDKEHLSDLSADPRWNAWIGMEQTEAKLKEKNNA